VAGFGFFLLLAGIIITLVLSLAGAPILVREPLAPAVGMDQFAIFYLMAQLIERLIEPFSEVGLTGHNFFGDTRKIVDNTEDIKEITDEITGIRAAKVQGKDLAKQASDLESLKRTKKEKTNEKREEHMTRIISMWGLASLMGMILCYFTVGLFEVVGTPFILSIHFEGGAINGHALDAILSGIVIGAGTKPLHDLIGYLEKAKDS
jgi:hypothetical protein